MTTMPQESCRTTQEILVAAKINSQELDAMMQQFTPEELATPHPEESAIVSVRETNKRRIKQLKEYIKTKATGRTE